MRGCVYVCLTLLDAPGTLLDAPGCADVCMCGCVDVRMCVCVDVCMYVCTLANVQCTLAVHVANVHCMLGSGAPAADLDGKCEGAGYVCMYVCTLANTPT